MSKGEIISTDAPPGCVAQAAASGSCLGCWFTTSERGCPTKYHCFSSLRRDGRSVIFIRKNPKPETTDQLAERLWTIGRDAAIKAGMMFDEPALLSDEPEWIAKAWHAAAAEVVRMNKEIHNEEV